MCPAPIPLSVRGMTSFRFAGHPQRNIVLLEVCTTDQVWTCEQSNKSSRWDAVRDQTWTAIPNGTGETHMGCNTKTFQSRFNAMMKEATDAEPHDNDGKRRLELIKDLQEKGFIYNNTMFIQLTTEYIGSISKFFY